ncbi:MAG TPA: hypothetical protein V6C84_05725 [Coleofasciculaceae cyanobacterium]
MRDRYFSVPSQPSHNRSLPGDNAKQSGLRRSRRVGLQRASPSALPLPTYDG